MFVRRRGIVYIFKKIVILFVCSLLFGACLKNLLNNGRLDQQVDPIESNRTTATAVELFHKVRILCFVLTSQPNHAKRAQHVRNTWGSRCNKLLFVSNVTEPEFGALQLQQNDDYHHLWRKTRHAVKYVYENFYNDYDWFYKADDDTYAFPDNMRFVLTAYSSDDPIYFGKKFNYSEELGYFSGGSGYVMSRRAVQKFVLEALPDGKKCRQEPDGAEDWNMGACMHNIGVFPGDARDRFQRERFLPFYPDAHLFGVVDMNWWYWGRLYYATDEGLDCCSNYTISFHYIGGDSMYAFDFFTYYLQVYGLRHVYDRLPAKKDFAKIVHQLIGEAGIIGEKEVLT